jgi:hypothetical protein
MIPRNGAVAVGSLAMDFNTFEIEVKQTVETVTPYGTNQNTKNAASATPDISINVGAFALAHGTNTPLAMPLLGGTSASVATNTSILTGIGTGATSTFTLDTGCTESGNVICESMKMSHGRMKGAIPVALSLRNQADFTEVWATSAVDSRIAYQMNSPQAADAMVRKSRRRHLFWGERAAV